VVAGAGVSVGGSGVSDGGTGVALAASTTSWVGAAIGSAGAPPDRLQANDSITSMVTNPKMRNELVFIFSSRLIVSNDTEKSQNFQALPKNYMVL